MVGRVLPKKDQGKIECRWRWFFNPRHYYLIAKWRIGFLTGEGDYRAFGSTLTPYLLGYLLTNYN